MITKVAQKVDIPLGDFFLKKILQRAQKVAQLAQFRQFQNFYLVKRILKAKLLDRLWDWGLF